MICAVSLIAGRKNLDSIRFVVAAGKLVYGLTGAFLLVTDYHAQLGYLVPWAWLLLVPASRDRPAELNQTFARTFLGLALAWQSLQAYPVSGTQAVIATFLPILAYSLCLHDAMKTFASVPRIAAKLQGLTPRVGTLSEIFIIAALFYLFTANWCDPISAWRYYASIPKLGLPGASQLQLPSEQAQTYQALTQYLKNQSDTFVTIPGLNSLYFWTGEKPPTYFNISEIVLLSDTQQTEVVSALRKTKRPLIILNRGVEYYFPRQGVLSET